MSAEAKNVLIVDDEEIVRDTLAGFVSLLGHESTLAGCTEEALEVLSKQEVDLMFVDIRMPGVDGFGLLEAARERHPGTKAVILAGFVTDELHSRADELGAIAFLVKPFSMRDLENVFETAAASGAASPSANKEA